MVAVVDMVRNAGLNKRSKRCFTFVVTPIAVTPDLILTLLHK